MKDGFYEKYKVVKADGTPIDPNAACFVLNLSTDLFARSAIAHYARICDNPNLRVDLYALLRDLEEADPDYLDPNPSGDKPDNDY